MNYYLDANALQGLIESVTLDDFLRAARSRNHLRRWALCRALSYKVEKFGCGGWI